MNSLIALGILAASSVQASDSMIFNVACEVVPGQVCGYDAGPGQSVECMPSGKSICSCGTAIDSVKGQILTSFPRASEIQFVQQDGSLYPAFARTSLNECAQKLPVTATFERN